MIDEQSDQSDLIVGWDHGSPRESTREENETHLTTSAASGNERKKEMPVVADAEGGDSDVRQPLLELQQGNRRVHFLRQVRVVVSLSHDQYTAEEKTNSWYHHEDLNDIREAYKEDIKMMRRRNREGIMDRVDDDFSSRGIEHLASSAIYSQRMQDQIHTVEVVMLGQRNNYTAERIAISYAQQCRESTTRAKDAAIIDAAEAGP